MAEEEKSDSNNDDEVISLEDLGEGGDAKEESVDDGSDEKGESDSKKEESAFDHYLASTDVVDEILATGDPKFSKSLKSLENLEGPEEGDPVDEESIEIAESLLDESIRPWQKLIWRFEILLKPIFLALGIVVRIKVLVLHGVNKLKGGIYYLAGDGRKKLQEKSAEAIAAGKEPVKEQVGIFKKMSWKGKIYFFLSLGVLGVSLFYARAMMNGYFLEQLWEPKITSLDTVADSIIEIEDIDEMELFNSPIRHPEFIILLKKMTVNLKPSPGIKNPMVVLEIFIEATHQTAAVELKDREPEVLDVIQREVESQTYPILVSKNGKKGLKVAISHNINRILTKGRVRKVLFKKMILTY